MEQSALEIYQDCALVIVAAGSGQRFGGPKQLASLAGKPLIVQTATAFQSLPLSARVMVIPADWLDSEGQWERLRAEHPALLQFTAVAGGQQRGESVLAGVAATPESCGIVLVHDGARPFPPLSATHQCLEMLKTHGHIAAVIVAAPMNDTVKRANGPLIEKTLNRDDLVRAETPQAAYRNLLLNALANHPDARDEAEAIERMGGRTACVRHHLWNGKITHPDDLAIASFLIEAQKENKT